MILNQAQAEAVYSAMCALNNIGGRVDARFGTLKVREHNDGDVFVYELLDGCWEPDERYENQSAFATAYGLQQG